MSQPPGIRVKYDKPVLLAIIDAIILFDGKNNEIIAYLAREFDFPREHWGSVSQTKYQIKVVSAEMCAQAEVAKPLTSHFKSITWTEQERAKFVALDAWFKQLPVLPSSGAATTPKASKASAPKAPASVVPKAPAPAPSKAAAPNATAPDVPNAAAPKATAPDVPKAAAPKTTSPTAPKTTSPAPPKAAAPKATAPAAPKSVSPPPQTKPTLQSVAMAAVKAKSAKPSSSKPPRIDAMEPTLDVPEPAIAPFAPEPGISPSNGRSQLDAQSASRPNGQVFISYNWGEGHRTHVIASELNTYLKGKGIRTWFDNEQVGHREVSNAVVNGMDNSDWMIVVLSTEYIVRVNATANVGCRPEFKYWTNVRDVTNTDTHTVYVLAEETMLDEGGRFDTGRLHGMFFFWAGNPVYFNICPGHPDRLQNMRKVADTVSAQQ
ncbi:hypothetical protein BASA82_000607 [Batrachochytrium salamandrivorans]|nr:hypothetical protein BASA82_000607 [Batrachochytrium salamandrivorans]